MYGLFVVGVMVFGASAGYVMGGAQGRVPLRWAVRGCAVGGLLMLIYPVWWVVHV